MSHTKAFTKPKTKRNCSILYRSVYVHLLVALESLLIGSYIGRISIGVGLVFAST